MISRIILYALTFSVYIILIPGCQTSKNRIPEIKLIQQAIADGNKISSETQQLLGTTLKSTIQRKGIPAALDYCSQNAYSLVDSLQHKYSVTIKRASHAARNPKDMPDGKEKNIIETYLKDLQEGRTPEIHVDIQSDEILYAKPILLNDAICLNCHGQPGMDVKEEDYRVIKALYPKDKATGHKLGDLRGIWSIRFNRKNLEKEVNETNEQIN